MGSLPGQGTQVRTLAMPADQLGPSDDGDIIEARGSVQLLLPKDLPRGFSCVIAQTEAGQVKLITQSGATIGSDLDKVAGEDGKVTILVPRNDDGASARYQVGGDLGLYNNTGPWTAHLGDPDGQYWVGVAWSPSLGLFAAVSHDGATKVMTSPDGVTWTARAHVGVGTKWNEVTWVAELGLFIATGYADAYASDVRIMTSPDGITWTARLTSTKNMSGGSVAYSSELGLAVVAANDATDAFVFTSPDGITWTEHNISSQFTDHDYYNPEHVVWSPERRLFVMTNDSGLGDCILSSPDGLNWTPRLYLAGEGCYPVTWSPELGLFVAMSDYTGLVFTSPDGITWTAASSVGFGSLGSIVWAKELGLFVAETFVGALTTKIVVSPDAETWTVVDTPDPANFWVGLAWSPELGLAVITAGPLGGAGRVATSNPL